MPGKAFCKSLMHCQWAYELVLRFIDPSNSDDDERQGPVCISQGSIRQNRTRFYRKCGHNQPYCLTIVTYKLDYLNIKRIILSKSD